MSKLLVAAALAALSVSKLEAELENGYPAETLEEALGLEKAKEEPRKTAIEALENAKPQTPAEEEVASPVIAKGKSITSLKGILEEGTPVSPDMFPGGQETFDDLKEKGFIKQ